MRQVPATLAAAWQSGQFVGDTRPIGRVTVHRPNIALRRTPENLFATLAFGGGTVPKELPNVKSITWNRGASMDVATCDIEFWNTSPLPVGATLTRDLDRPGWFTYNRGTTTYSGRWGHTPNEWSGMLMPDNILTTFEGYGCNPNVCPELDPFLVQTGVWMIDDVEYAHDGTIKVTCRDVGRLLIDHIAFPPVVPFKSGFRTKDLPDGAYAYPVSFAGRNSEPIVNNVPNAPSRLAMSYRTSSNLPHFGEGPIHGHYARDAFDDNDATYWYSVGNLRPDQGYAFEYVEGSIKKERVRRVRFKSLYKGHTVYLGLYVEGQGWIGDRKVPYNPNHPVVAIPGTQNGSDEKFHRAMAVNSTGWSEFNLGDGVANVTRVRITFGGLQRSPHGPYPHRAGVRQFQVFGGATSRREVITFADKNYDDYTDIVKLLCAWGGFYWPRNATRRRCDGATISVPFNRDDRAITIKQGRVWGDFQLSGTSGPSPIPHSVFDKKPLMDGIAYVRDILGYLFFIDEYGGAVFKAPNIYAVGNTMRSLGSSSGNRTTQMVTIDERRALMGLTARLSSRNLRERTFVSNANGTIGHVAAGWNPNPIGLRRVGGWTDQHFETAQECRVMAEMIALRQLFTYRADTITIPGYPAIQVDDQVRVFERVTSEGYIHYVEDIQSSLDHQSGEYTYQLTTHWLGERPFKRWVFDPAQLSRETQDYLRGLYG